MQPLDFPVCGPLGDLCLTEGPNFAVILSVILSVILVMVFIIGYLVYRHFREEAAIASMHWKISPEVGVEKCISIFFLNILNESPPSSLKL